MSAACTDATITGPEKGRPTAAQALTTTKTIGIEARGYEQLAQSRHAAAPRPGIELLIAAYHGATTPPLPDLDRRPAFNSANYMSSWLSRRNIAYRLFNHGGARRRAAGAFLGRPGDCHHHRPSAAAAAAKNVPRFFSFGALMLDEPIDIE